jgi:glycosyltransferase involved in cell wall biosynthesis
LAADMITIFTPSFADEGDTNAQNLTVKEVVARLSPDEFRVVMFYEEPPDPRIVARRNTELIRWRSRGNTLRTVLHWIRETPDVYFFPREGPLDAAFLKLRERWGKKTALVTYVVSGGLYNPEAPRPTLVRNVLQADSVFANCEYLSQLVEQRMGVEAGVRYDGIDRRFYYPAAKPQPGRLTVLFAGSLRPYKRTDLLVREAARWPNVDFRILGRGEEEQRCRDMAKELECSNVVFAGHMTSAQVGDEMRNADIFFFPSILEGHPQVLAQAAASGLPAVAMNIYRPEFVVHEQTGYLVSSDEELSEKLGLLINRPEIRRFMSEAAIIHSHRFDWDRISVQWGEAFTEAVAKRRNL